MTQTRATYDVVLLIEQPLTTQDAAQVRGLHGQVTESVRYHLLLPVADAALRVQSAMGSLAGGEILATPPVSMDATELEDAQRELLARARADVSESARLMVASGADASGDVVSVDPVDALAQKVQEVGAAEAIILTRPHVLAEFFHRDWTSKARRRLGVPVLHLLEHETFDEQAGGGEGVSGM